MGVTSMTHCYIQIGIQMSQEELTQVKQDMERLVSDVKKLMTSDDKTCCTSEDGKISCHAKCGNHGKAIMCLGLAALVAGIVGAMIAKKQST